VQRQRRNKHARKACQKKYSFPIAEHDMSNRLWLSIAAGGLAALVIAPAAALAQQRQDQVFLAKGAPTRGDILDSGMGRDEVSLDLGGVPKTFQVNEIVRITFKDEPPELNAARTQVLQRNYNQAMTELKKLDGQRIERALVKQDADFFRALCQCRLAMSEGGDKAAAMTAMLNFVKSAPQNYHFYDAAETLGDLAMTSGKWADAAKYYGPIASARWPDYQMRANNAIGRALTGDKQYEAALDKYKAVLDTDLATPEALRQKSLASVGKAVCLAETGKAEDGVAALVDLIGKNDPQDSVLFARAYNALGRCYLKLNKPKDAVLALLHTDVLFYSDADAHAEALYQLSKLWNDVNKSDRAIAARNTLRERYAGSIWATLE
jgi:tetratricopeptide (TPR) repeat protein